MNCHPGSHRPHFRPPSIALRHVYVADNSSRGHVSSSKTSIRGASRTTAQSNAVSALDAPHVSMLALLPACKEKGNKIHRDRSFLLTA